METQEMLIVSIVLPPRIRPLGSGGHPNMEIKERILETARELFFKYGIRSISMDDIAKELSISKKTIYQAYKDKDEVVHKLFQKKMELDQKKFHEVSRAAENVIEEMFNIMEQMRRLIGQVNPSVFYDLQKYHSDTWKLLKEFREDRIVMMVEEMLVRGMKQGYIRPDIHPKILARLRVEQIEMSFNPNIFAPEKFKVVDVQIALLENFLYGICTLKGHKLINKYKQITDEE